MDRKKPSRPKAIGIDNEILRYYLSERGWAKYDELYGEPELDLNKIKTKKK